MESTFEEQADTTAEQATTDDRDGAWNVEPEGP